jgi:hypothetical protein
MDDQQVSNVVEQTLNKLRDPYHFDLVATAVLAILILVIGYLVLKKVLWSGDPPNSVSSGLSGRNSLSQDQPVQRSFINIWSERLGDHTLQIVGLTFIIPTILMVAVATKLNSDAVTALLGSIIGYLFGSAKSPEKPATSASGLIQSPAAPVAQSPTQSAGEALQQPTAPIAQPPPTATGEPEVTPPVKNS